MAASDWSWPRAIVSYVPAEDAKLELCIPQPSKISERRFDHNAHGQYSLVSTIIFECSERPGGLGPGPHKIYFDK